MNCEHLIVHTWVVIASNGFRTFTVAPIEKVSRRTIQAAGACFDKFNGRVQGASDMVICALATQKDIDNTLRIQFSKGRGFAKPKLLSRAELS